MGMHNREKLYILVFNNPHTISVSLIDERPHVFSFSPKRKSHITFIERESVRFRKFSPKYNVMNLYLRDRTISTFYPGTECFWIEVHENDIVFFNALKEIPQKDRVWLECLSQNRTGIIRLLKLRLFAKKVGRYENKD